MVLNSLLRVKVAGFKASANEKVAQGSDLEKTAGFLLSAFMKRSPLTFQIELQSAIRYQSCSAFRS
jgi:hypothetical protein